MNNPTCKAFFKKRKILVLAIAPETPEPPPKRGNHGGESVRCISLPGTLEAHLEGAFHFLFSVSPQGLTLEDPTGDPGSSAGERKMTMGIPQTLV